MVWRARLQALGEEILVCSLSWVATPVGMLLRLYGWRWFFKRCGNVRFGTSLTISGMKNISLGNGVRLGKGCFLTAGEGSLEIDEDTAIGPNVNIGADNGTVSIGRYCAIGPGTVIRAANHRFDRLDCPIIQQGHTPGYVVIEDDVWIGANCVITPDVCIGRGSVVGAGSVVTRNVEPFVIAGGVPARIIGRRKEKS